MLGRRRLLTLATGAAQRPPIRTSQQPNVRMPNRRLLDRKATKVAGTRRHVAAFGMLRLGGRLWGVGWMCVWHSRLPTGVAELSYTHSQ